MARRNPGGYGGRKGTDSYVDRAESRFVREATQPADDGWLVTTAGENVMNHLDVTGVLTGSNRLGLYYVPARSRNVWASEVRLMVAAAVASTTAEVAVFSYEGRIFKKVPFTHALLDTSTTGLKTATLTQPALLAKDSVLFIGVVVRNAAVALEGFQSGTASTGRVCRARTMTEPSSPRGSYTLTDLSLAATQDTPMVAYLSKEAALVL
jgi:hypothetical protein